jgi:predicted DNA binding CopG/RHH family protein
MTKTKSKIPTFKNIQEEAEFWDTHDTADFENEFKPVEIRFGKNLSNALSVRFESEDVAKIREVAHKKGIGPTTLVRMWVREHLHA